MVFPRDPQAPLGPPDIDRTALLSPELREEAEALARAFLRRYPMQDETQVRESILAFLKVLGSKNHLMLVARSDYRLAEKLRLLADDIEDESPLPIARVQLRDLDVESF